MPSRKPDEEEVEVAKTNAELAAEHAAKAVEQAVEATHEAAEVEAKSEGTHACPACTAPLVKHAGDNPHKQGAWHCTNEACGKCWQPGLREERL